MPGGELEELRKILDSKTPLRKAGSGAGVGAMGDGAGDMDVNQIMARFNKAGAAGGSPYGGAGGGHGASSNTPADEIAAALTSYGNSMSGTEVRAPIRPA